MDPDLREGHRVALLLPGSSPFPDAVHRLPTGEVLRRQLADAAGRSRGHQRGWTAARSRSS